jgi:hypothetical protein
MKQEYGSKNCVAVVAAQAFDSSVRDFEIWSGTKAPYSIAEFIRFGLSKGYITGFYCFQKPKIYFGKIVETVDITKMAALVIVKSDYQEDETHACYWNGERLFDPNPGSPDGRTLKEYEIQEWYPIFKL